MTERRGTKALELWCRRITDGYPGVNVQNMTTSWRDGLAFCAMIHHFRPDLIDFNSLNKDDVYGNNELAFRTAAEHLGIPALLDAEDMASCSVPDRLSILTYLSQFYQSFGGSSPSRLALSRTKESSNEGITPVPESTTPKVGPRMGMRRDPCAVCGMPVFLAEKLVISRTPYHRTCFRCARCKNQLTPGNYYETEEGEYCCETCPDEEEETTTKSPLSEHTLLYHESNRDAMLLINEQREYSKPQVYKRSLSDEEKTSHRARLDDKKCAPRVNDKDEISSTERRRNSEIRMSFMTENFLTKNTEDRATDISHEKENEEEDTTASSIIEQPKNEGDRPEPKGTLKPSWLIDENVTLTKTIMPSPTPKYETIDTDNIDISSLSDSTSNDTLKRANKNNSLNQLELIINDYDRAEDTRTSSSSFTHTANHEHTNNSNNINIPRADDASAPAVAAAAAALDDSKNSTRTNTKDTIGPNIDTEPLSLVQKRLKLFETRRIVEDFVKNSSVVVSSSSTSCHERNNDSTVTNVGDEEDCHAVEPNIGKFTEAETLSSSSSTTIEQDKSLTDGVVQVVTPPSVDLASQENKITSPPVPKRSNNKQSRKSQHFDTKKSDVTVLNASGIDLSENEANYPSDLNPFDCDDVNNDDEQEITSKKPQSSSSEAHGKNHQPRVSTNPFGSSEDEEDDQEDGQVYAPPRPATRNINKTSESLQQSHLQYENEAPTKRRLKAPIINFNPFLSDEEEEHETDDDDDDESLNRSSSTNTPVPKPRTIKHTADTLLSPWKHDFTRGDIYASNSSIASTGSTSTTGGTCRKKKHAPPPPVAKELFASPGDSLGSTNSLPSSNNSLRSTPKARKAKPAPPPPLPTSTPCGTSLKPNIAIPDSSIIDTETWKDPKNDKDVANLTTQNMTNVSSDDTNPFDSYTDKSVQGKWKRKKGPAPARPIPHRRKIKVMSLKDVKLELDEIEMQQQGLERQGVRLEQLIRDKAETGSAAEDANLGLDVEELVLELFALVNEKNELFRRQAELMLLRRQQRLEEEHADIEYQIRCLLCQPEATKTDFDKQREETLIQRLVEIVERRNEIVECLEMDRRREVEEDRSINTQMGIYAAKNKGEFAKEVEEQLDEEERNRSKKSKKTKLKDKAKEKILRKVQKKDADKDVDETEVKLKRQNKKKWF